MLTPILFSTLQQTTPDTGDYLVLGLIVSFVVFFGYIGTIVWRYISLQRDATVIAAIEEENETTPATDAFEEVQHAR